jgi:hypothetical protein
MLPQIAVQLYGSCSVSQSKVMLNVGEAGDVLRLPWHAFSSSLGSMLSNLVG